jgi:hypothetical protein
MTKEEHMDVEASFDNTDLEALTERVKRILDIRDRKYGFPSKTYAKCFVGSEAVAQLVAEGIASDEEDAVHIGNMMLNAGVFHHVLDAHPFKNEDLFYALCRMRTTAAWHANPMAAPSAGRISLPR